MKYVILITFILFSVACVSSKTKTANRLSEYKIGFEDYMKSKPYIIDYPEGWRVVPHHGYYGFTPLSPVENFFENLTSFFEYNLMEKTSFEEFVLAQIESTNVAFKEYGSSIIAQKTIKEDSRFGVLYIHEFEYISSMEDIKHKRHVRFFEQNGEYYNYTYMSMIEHYEQYYEDAIALFESIQFK